MKRENRIKALIEEEFNAAFERKEVAPPTLRDEMVLLESGLDSLGFAILVTSLEDRLGYDPFTLMDEPVYPRTFKEFTDIYLKFADHVTHDVVA